MPAVSKAQQSSADIALHNPSKLLKRNSSMLKMSAQQLHDYAAVSRKFLPKRVTLGHLMKGGK